ncbi:MAG: hypothetical protein F4X72_00835 [Dehalococcoidia bacterium]|nr:hypothetical protein [Dehalococcoidia bacterium]
MDRANRIQFFAIALPLKVLSDSQELGRLSEMYSSYSDKRNATGLLLGYKLVMESILYRQIDLVVTCPEILHLQVDDDLFRWWSDLDGRSARRLKDITEVDAPMSTLVASYINELLLRVDRTGNRLKEFTEVSAEVSAFAQMVLSMARSCDLSGIQGTDSGPRQDIDLALRMCGAEYLYDLLYDEKDYTLDDAFDYIGAGSVEWVEGSILEGLGQPAVETSRDIVGTLPHRLNSLSTSWRLGIHAASATAIQGLTGQQRVIRTGDTNLPPAAELFGDMLEEFQVGRWPSTRYGLTFQNGAPGNELEEMMAQETSPSDTQELLRTLLGDSAFLASGMSSNAEFHFRVLIEGLIKAEPSDAQIDVLQMEHAGPSDEAHPPVSLAVRVGREWHVFYYIDAVGRMKSWVWPFLDGLGERVKITRIPGVDTEYLLRLCDRAFQYVARQWKSQKDLNGDLRGVIPELLAALLLANSNNFPVRPSLEVEGIGEIDAIGYKGSADGGECKILEVKRRSTDQLQLRAEVEKFKAKIQRARQNRRAIEEALGCPGPIKALSGTFISMAEIGDLTDEAPDSAKAFMGLPDSTTAKAEFKSFLDSLSEIDFWDYDRFHRELETANLPELPIRLIEHARLTWMLPDVYVGGERGMSGVLQKAVENDNWQRPGSSDALKNTLEDTLRNKEV